MSYIGKYDADDAIFMEYRKQIPELCDDPIEVVDNWPAYVGPVNWARFRALYEIYRQTINLAGHIADIGSYKGASLLFFAKYCIKIDEPYSPTEAHGFEWFKGQQPGPQDDAAQKGKYVANKERLERLIKAQGLSTFCKLNDIDLINESHKFFEANPHVRYKLVFIDCGIRQVMEAVKRHFFPRIVPGGIVILDHFNDPVSPSESSLFDGYEMFQLPYTRSPTAYFVKR